jgi:YfiH family protein
MTNKSYITFPIFDQFNELTCAFSTRIGGFSEGPFASFNMGNIKFDDPKLITKNRNLFFDIIGINKKWVALPDQIHSANIKTIYRPGIVPKTDALISKEKGLFIGVQTADCFPIFIYAPRISTIAIIHAGWRGVVQNIVIKALQPLLEQPGSKTSDLYVAIGPGLQSDCFEVRSDVYKQFPDNFLKPHPDTSKKYLDLSGLLVQQFLSLNIPSEHIYQTDDCTKCNQERYFSFRRDGEMTGRMMGIIGINF